MKQKNRLIDYPYDLLDELLNHNNKLIYDYENVVNNFDENWDYIKTTLSCKEASCIELHFKEGLTLKEVGKEIGLTSERVRQIIAKGIRKLSHPSRLNILIKGHKNLEELKSLNKEINNEIIELRKKYHELYKMQCEDWKNLEDIPKPLIAELKSAKNIPIEDLDFSSRAYRCLKRANKNTLEEVINLSECELYHIRNLGIKTAGEICDKVRELGFKMSFDDNYDHDEKNAFKIYGKK